MDGLKYNCCEGKLVVIISVINYLYREGSIFDTSIDFQLNLMLEHKSQ
jgi:hypothetical protein